MENLRNLRLKKGYSQSQLGDFINVGAGVVARWETMQTAPTMTQILKICHLLGCKPAELYHTDHSSDGIDKHKTIPVFEGDKVYIRTIPSDSNNTCVDFGIVLSCDMGERLCKGDVCFFTIQKHAEYNNIALVSDDGYNCEIAVYRKNDNCKVMAVCTLMHRQL